MILWQQMNEIKNLIIYRIASINIETIQASEVYADFLDTQFQGSWARDLFNAFLAGDQSCVLREIAQYAFRLVDGWSSVQAERDDHNNARDIAPPVLPQQLVTLRMDDFIAGVHDMHCGHVGLYWKAHDVNQIEN
ncbi:hypothetical protein CCR75_004466 [Bremia lactucae]|uniref:Uncharacterized protein n=1 Tax=Bremia lactucae TaxID=4779 RepID=A0A976FKA0_BRELC|nr:hypothetical protein CCR75_004466 [Bremia lactucae]